MGVSGGAEVRGASPSPGRVSLIPASKGICHPLSAGFSHYSALLAHSSLKGTTMVLSLRAHYRNTPATTRLSLAMHRPYLDTCFCRKMQRRDLGVIAVACKTSGRGCKPGQSPVMCRQGTCWATQMLQDVHVPIACIRALPQSSKGHSC